MESRKKGANELICKTRMKRRCREWTCGHSSGRRGWDELRQVALTCIHLFVVA